MYKTTELRQIFGVSRQTIASWCGEFSEYLSPTATPSNGTHRQLSDDDVRVMALVAEMSRAGRKFEEIHISLRADQRGDLPDITALLAQIDPETQLILYKTQVLELQAVVENIQRQRDEAIGQAKLLREMYTDATTRIQELFLNMARLEARLERPPDD